MQPLEFDLLAEEYCVCQLEPGTVSPVPDTSCELYSISYCSDEVSVVAPVRLAPQTMRTESGWRCLRIRGPLEFSLTGVLAAVSSALSGQGIPLFCISTFNTDYFLIESGQLGRAIDTLVGEGHRVHRQEGNSNDV